MLSAGERREAKREVLRIATEAAALVMTGWRAPGAPEPGHKGEIDLVTDFDLRSEELIRSELGRTLAGCDVVAEEEGGRARGDRPVVYVDPLDGTTNYAHGHPFFAVSIGIVSGTVLEAGVVVAPAIGCVWTAARESGATRNGSPCRVSAVDALDGALLATGFPYDRRTSPENNFRTFVEMKKRVQGVRRCGAASIDLCFVADGTYDGYWEKKLEPWDLAAGAMAVLEAGGQLSAFDGGPADVRTGALVASNGRIHEALRRAVAEAESLPAF